MPRSASGISILRSAPEWDAASSPSETRKLVMSLPPPTGPAAPPDLYVCPFVVLQDNSEQLPFTFQGIVISGKQQWIVKRQRCELKTGDYSIAGLSHLYTVERKSPDDLVGSVCGGHAGWSGNTSGCRR